MKITAEVPVFHFFKELSTGNLSFIRDRKKEEKFRCQLINKTQVKSKPISACRADLVETLEIVKQDFRIAILALKKLKRRMILISFNV